MLQRYLNRIAGINIHRLRSSQSTVMSGACIQKIRWQVERVQLEENIILMAGTNDLLKITYKCMDISKLFQTEDRRLRFDLFEKSYMSRDRNRISRPDLIHWNLRGMMKVKERIDRTIGHR
ncbi:hypothetical protein CHUAL_013505 [Chamberlinius hualienensis]